MPRPISAAMLAVLTSPVLRLALFVQLTFTDQTIHAWSGVGDYLWNGATWKGVGDLGQVGEIAEGSTVAAQGTSITLSGINPTLIHEALQELQVGAPAAIYLGAFDANLLLIDTICIYGGYVDKSQIKLNAAMGTLTITLESKLIKLQSGQQRRYTAADQALTHPDDTAFNWVESLNDVVLHYGQ